MLEDVLRVWLTRHGTDLWIQPQVRNFCRNGGRRWNGANSWQASRSSGYQSANVASLSSRPTLVVAPVQHFSVQLASVAWVVMKVL